MFFNEKKKSYRCGLGIVASFDTHKRYNCVDNGRCARYKSEEEHKKEVAVSQEERDRENYIRLKKKYEGVDI